MWLLEPAADAPDWLRLSWSFSSSASRSLGLLALDGGGFMPALHPVAAAPLPARRWALGATSEEEGSPTPP